MSKPKEKGKPALNKKLYGNSFEDEKCNTDPNDEQGPGISGQRSQNGTLPLI